MIANPSTSITGWGVDAEQVDRPGVPRDYDPPMPMGNPSLGIPPRMQATPSVSSPHRGITPVFSTVGAPRLLSGVVRRLAYTIPDYKARRFLLLMMADRIDVLEHKLIPAAAIVGIGLLGAGTALGIRALARR